MAKPKGGRMKNKKFLAIILAGSLRNLSPRLGEVFAGLCERVLLQV